MSIFYLDSNLVSFNMVLIMPLIEQIVRGYCQRPFDLPDFVLGDVFDGCWLIFPNLLGS